MKILHCSDPHFDLSLRRMPLRKWFGKRAIGALNLLGGRGKYFDKADEKIIDLAKFKRENNIDLVICTGDFTALGLSLELEESSILIEPLAEPPESFIAIPGNHDVYAYDVIREDNFNRYFGKYMKSDWPQYAVDDDIWPIVRLFGDDIAIIALNSSKPNPFPWHSHGYIPDRELEMFDKILDDNRIKNRFIFVATHYAARLKNGKADTKQHGLKNADDFLKICRKIKRGAILNGHVHHCFKVDLSKDGLSIPEYCAGSVTMDKRECFWLFDIEKDKIEVKKGVYADGKYQLVDSI